MGAGKDPLDALPPRARAFLEGARVARLATVDAHARPHLVPIVFVVVEGCLYFPLDAKPKRVPPERLRRVRNLQENPSVAVLVDRYEEDWSRLAFVLVEGEADLLTEGPERDRALEALQAKYPQYRAMPLEGAPVVRIRPRRATAWGNFS